MKDLIIIGAGGHGRVVADIAQKLGIYKNIAFLDDGDAIQSMGLPIIGKSTEAEKYIPTTDLFVAIGNNHVRQSFLEKLLSLGASVPVLSHPNAVIGSYVTIGAGTVIMAGAIINPCSTIGKGVILNTCSSVDHDCVIGDYCHVAVGAHIAGTVCIENQVFLGAGSVVKNNISVCSDCMIGAGAVVVKNITQSGTYVGVPAKKNV